MASLQLQSYLREIPVHINRDFKCLEHIRLTIDIQESLETV